MCGVIITLLDEGETVSIQLSGDVSDDMDSPAQRLATAFVDWVMLQIQFSGLEPVADGITVFEQ